MFRYSNLKSKINEQAEEIKNLNEEVIRLEKALAVAHANLQELKDNEDTTIATPSLDFNAIRCFSIERQRDSYGVRTTIGYSLLHDSDNVGPREWNLYCSLAHHEKLVEQFNKQKKAK